MTHGSTMLLGHNTAILHVAIAQRLWYAYGGQLAIELQLTDGNGSRLKLHRKDR